MNDMVLHAVTRQQVERFVRIPSHGLMLVGPVGVGKRTLAIGLAETILGLPPNGLASHPYALQIDSPDGRAIGIEAVRQLEQFLTLKVPGTATYDRAIIIEAAQLLTLEAQNALLKTLEEPPAGTILILTTSHEQAVLPTIRSRLQAITVKKPEQALLAAHFRAEGYSDELIRQNYAISAGLPGLLQALLNQDDHPLRQATARARQLLSQPVYERLLMVDELSKQIELARNVTFILQQMAHISLQSAQGAAARKWQHVLQASYQAGEMLAGNAQSKLALTNLMLSL